LCRRLERRQNSNATAATSSKCSPSNKRASKCAGVPPAHALMARMRGRGAPVTQQRTKKLRAAAERWDERGAGTRTFLQAAAVVGAGKRTGKTHKELEPTRRTTNPKEPAEDNMSFIEITHPRGAKMKPADEPTRYREREARLLSSRPTPNSRVGTGGAARAAVACAAC